MLDHLSHAVAKWLDTASAAAIVMTFLGWLPHIAAGLSVVWVAIRISNEILDRRIKKQEFAINERRLAEPVE